MRIVGRRSSLFTRVPLVFAEELGVSVELVPIADLNCLESELYAGNPALKMPVLRSGVSVLFGAQNICRALAERSTRSVRILWPEGCSDDLARNAHELVSHCMTAQVQIAMGAIVNGLPAENAYFVKARAGLAGALSWLDARVDEIMRVLPPHDLSFLEVSLFCLLEHLEQRPTVSTERYEGLARFRRGSAWSRELSSHLG